MDKIQTVLHTYSFDVSEDKDRAAFNALVPMLKAIGFPVWREKPYAFASGSKEGAAYRATWARLEALNGKPVTLECQHLFDNQWNAESESEEHENGLRLFNWVQYEFPNKDIISGYWLEQTDTMREVLRNTHKCGYCGHHEPAQKGYVFCPACIDSEYLTVDDLPLTRMVSVRDTNKPRAALTKAERDYLIPLYREAQKNGTTKRGIARLAQAKQDIENDFEKTVRVATIKRDAARWIVANIPQLLSNWIFYDHHDTHCFGWRDKLTADEKAQLLEVLNEFPFNYEVRCMDGNVLARRG